MQFEIASLNIFHAFFSGFISNVGLYDFLEIPADEIHIFYYKNKEALEFVSSIMKEFDTGIEKIEVARYRNKVDDTLTYFPIFHHKTEKGIKKLRIQHQSSGTRRLYHLLGQLFKLIKAGNEVDLFSRVWIADELDLHLHSMITPRIIDQIERHANIQLIFTCQSNDLMNNMGKYRITLVSKEQNESYTYRLDEVSSDLLRNRRPISPHYVNGRLGGVPNFG
jgi:hypothetical protein